jgi:flagellar hook assembly protein FlgD
MKNDEFDILANAINIEHLSEWIVFDEAGRKVFESRTQSVWDGTDASGNICPAGSYRYIVRATDTSGRPVEKSGIVRLFDR